MNDESLLLLVFPRCGSCLCGTLFTILNYNCYESESNLIQSSTGGRISLKPSFVLGLLVCVMHVIKPSV